MRRLPVAAALAVLLAACGESRPAAEADAPAPPAAAQTTQEPSGDSSPDLAPDPSPLSDPAAEPIAGEADSAWVELIGVWAQTGRCADDMGRWIIEGDAFHLFEMHCAIDRLELLRNGVKATAQCTVEGDDDGEADSFWFLRQGDGSLTIAEGEGGFANTGLFLCEESVEL